MCFFLYVASPLTLSEVRSMLNEDLTADALPPADVLALRTRHYDTQTVARILRGACSCDLFRPRDPDRRTDEAYHRRRYRELGYARDRVIAALEMHRRGPRGRPRPPGFWPRTLAAFVREHARNAGPTWYFYHFSHDGLLADERATRPARTIHAAAVTDDVAGWLPEAIPVVVEA